MMQLPSTEFVRRRNTTSNSSHGLICRTVFRSRGYSYRAYKTELEEGVFKLHHYSTRILEVDLLAHRIAGYGGWSQSDRSMITRALWQLGFDNHHIRNGSERPPRGFVLWHSGMPLKENGTPYELKDLSQDDIRWLRRRRKSTLMRGAAMGWDWERWAYEMLYGPLSSNQTTLTGESPIIPAPFQKRTTQRRCGRRRWRCWRTPTLTQWMGRTSK